ncbi:hypothetical protein LTR17_006899 [Elasticomyces elasticus]|nr:hypothetical protein LTR17_006899 [Elasticomyces elasticus]
MIWTFSLLGEDGIQFAPYKATPRHPLLRTSRQTRTELLEAMLRLDTKLLLPSTALTRLHGADIFGLIQRFTRYSLRLRRMREWGSVPVFLMWYRRTGRSMMAMVWGYGDAPGSRHFISLPSAQARGANQLGQAMGDEAGGIFNVQTGDHLEPTPRSFQPQPPAPLEAVYRLFFIRPPNGARPLSTNLHHEISRHSIFLIIDHLPTMSSGKRTKFTSSFTIDSQSLYIKKTDYNANKTTTVEAKEPLNVTATTTTITDPKNRTSQTTVTARNNNPPKAPPPPTVEKTPDKDNTKT